MANGDGRAVEGEPRDWRVHAPRPAAPRPELLGDEPARLRRCAHRPIWLNPLAADPRWEPLTRGMVAASPHLDRVLPGNSLRSLRKLADLREREDL